MTVDKALQIIEKIKQEELERYNESPESKDSSGQRIPHPLDSVDEDDELFALDIALKTVALRTIPQSLLESVADSTAEVLKRVSKDYFVRVPRYPQKGEKLDIDASLVYAVIFLALSEIYSGFNDFAPKGDAICNEYNNALRKVLDDMLSGATPDKVAYIRFSADGQNWHDSYQDGDIYISFKRIDTDTWTPAIRFVGEDGRPCSDTQFTALQDTPASYTGAGGKVVAVNTSEDGVEFIDPPSGGGASTFKELADTPNDYAGAKGKKVVVKQTEDGLEYESDTFTSLEDTPADYANAGGKFVAVKSDATGLEFVDAPAGGGGVSFNDRLDGSVEASGTIALDLYNPSTSCRWYFELTGDLTLKFNADSEGYQGVDGRLYIFHFSPNGYNVTWDSNISWRGDASIPNNTPCVLLAYYDGIDWYVMVKNTY